MTRMSFENADELRDFLFTIIESMPTGILLADGDGNLLALNQLARGLLGLSSGSLSGRSCWEVLARATGMPAADFSGLRQAEGRVMCRVAPTTEAGQARILAVTRNNLKSPFLYISGFFLTVEDVTYVSMLEAQVERQKRFSAMQAVAVNMSLELKNPLGGLELYASLLKRELADDPEPGGIVERMQQAVRSMDHLLNNYLTLASMPKPHYERVDIRDWLEDTVAELRAFLHNGDGLEIRLDCRHKGASIAGDGHLLRQLAFNLGLNGLESMKRGGVLRIATRDLPGDGRQPGLLEILFSDEGGGIAREHLEEIFDPFFTTKDKGNGLGLAIVHHVAEVHRGLVQVENRESGGAVFKVLLPREAGGPG